MDDPLAWMLTIIGWCVLAWLVLFWATLATGAMLLHAQRNRDRQCRSCRLAMGREPGDRHGVCADLEAIIDAIR